MKRLLIIAIGAFVALNTTAQDPVKARLENSPRHLEWVKVKNGKREVNSFIAFPEVKQRVTAVVVIHEIFGLSDWVRGVTDQLAEAGYITIEKGYQGKKPHTMIRMTEQGRSAFKEYKEKMQEALSSLPD